MSSSQRFLTMLFAMTLFVSAALLFSVQPMVARMLLPLLGGTPAVWNVCMLFFQAALLAGYGYALVASRWELRTQLAFQLLLLALAFVSLPIGLSLSWVNSVPTTSNPAAWLLLCLAAIVGLPFFIVSSNGPLLQKWFSNTPLRTAGDPYFLYSASNAGSLGALLAYPVLLEPSFALGTQSRIWTVGYSLLVLLVCLCGLAVLRISRNTSAHNKALAFEAQDSKDANAEERRTSSPTGRRRLNWLLLAFVPSSLMLGVTSYMSTDIAAVPLLWVIPLALYLLTLVIAFAKRQFISLRALALILPGATLLFLLIYLSRISATPRVMIFLSLVYFFLAALTCHSQLAADRPATTHLPEFYFWMSLGGVLGGLFNALIAPQIFTSVTEYPLVMLLACLLLPKATTPTGSRRALWLTYLIPVGILLFTLMLGVLTTRFAPGTVVGLLLVLALPMFLTYPFRKQPLRFVLCLGAVMLGAGFVAGNDSTLHLGRNFFGVLRVARDESNSTHSLIDGNTVHGRQYTSIDRRCEPLSYYHREGPVAKVFAAFQASEAVRNVAVIGLGAGGMIAYAKPNETWTFYEINPAVVNIARNAQLFTYVGDCAPAPINIVLGDARLKLRDAPASGYGLLVLDAFSSDAIPIHLVTQEALDLYLSKLAPGGLLLFNISNRNLDLSPVLAALARSRNLSSIGFFDVGLAKVEGKDSSVWVVMARNQTDLGALASSAYARPLNGDDRHLWTDDFSDILSVFRWH